MKLKDVMRKVVVSEPGVSVKKAAEIMSSKNISSLIIIEKEKMIGIVTEKDITKSFNKSGNKVSSIMSKNVKSTDIDTSVDNAATIMAEHNIRILPITEKGKLVGVIDAKDLIEHSDVLNENFFLD